MPIKNVTSHRGPLHTVGFLVDWLQDSYQWSILQGARDAAHDRRANLLCFTGGVLGAPVSTGATPIPPARPVRGARRDGVFDLAGPGSVDALVILSGSVGNHVGAERLREWCERFRPLPMCSIALDLEGISSVTIDNDVGMRHLLGHLVQHHQAKRIAFVRGPEANPEAERRFALYQEALGEAQIPLDLRLVAPGDFQAESGEKAVALFLDERRVRMDDIDALVCANDLMALGALEELERRGIRVPDRVALVGFDDIEEARFTAPPLTTVRQPLRKQGREAVGMVLDQIRGGARVQKVVLDTDLTTRRSCGCFGRRVDQAVAPPSVSGLGFEALLLGRRQLILADLSRASRGAFGAAGVGWEQRLLHAFGDQLRGHSSASFVEAYEDVLRKLSLGGVDLSICYDVAATLRRHLLVCVANQPHLRPVAEGLLDEIGERTGNVMERAQAWHRIHIQRRARSLGLAGSTIVTTFDLDDLAAAVRASLPVLGIESCYVSVFEEGPAHQRRSRLVLAYTAESPAAPPARRRHLPRRGSPPLGCLALRPGARVRGGTPPVPRRGAGPARPPARRRGRARVRGAPRSLRLLGQIRGGCVRRSSPAPTHRELVREIHPERDETRCGDVAQLRLTRVVLLRRRATALRVEPRTRARPRRSASTGLSRGLDRAEGPACPYSISSS